MPAMAGKLLPEAEAGAEEMLTMLATAQGIARTTTTAPTTPPRGGND